jgi:predicted neutral ceramidase superfamily lipid hydrolase
MVDVERNIMESENRAVLYLDLLGFAALTEENPHYFMSEPVQRSSWPTWPTNLAVSRLSMFHQVLEFHISGERPNHAMVFSDCAFAVFYTPCACADFATVLMREFLDVKVPVRMGLGYGTFRAIGANRDCRSAAD